MSVFEKKGDIKDTAMDRLPIVVCQWFVNTFNTKLPWKAYLKPLNKKSKKSDKLDVKPLLTLWNVVEQELAPLVATSLRMIALRVRWQPRPREGKID